MGHMSPRIKIKKGRPLAGWVPGDTPVVTITAGDANPDINANPNTSFIATAVDTEQGDMAASLQWEVVSAFEVPATSGLAIAQNGDVGATTTAAATANHNFDVDVDGAGSATFTIALVNGLSYTAIAALMDTALAGASVAFSDSTGFVITSDSDGINSSIVIAAGTGGNPDLFNALDVADSNTTTFPAGTPGADLVPEETVLAGTGANPSLNFLVVGAQNVRAFVVDGGVTGDDTRATTVVSP